MISRGWDDGDVCCNNVFDLIDRLIDSVIYQLQFISRKSTESQWSSWNNNPSKTSNNKLIYTDKNKHTQ